MKYLKQISTYSILSLLVIVLFSCSAEDGETGPQGPQGEQGAQGPAGTDGQDGEDGNANVIALDWFTPSTYEVTSNSFGINYLEHDEEVVEITQDVLDSSVILTYGKLNGYTDSVWPQDHASLMPITVTYNSDIDVWTALISPGNLKIRFQNNNNTYTVLSTAHSFRCVIIPSSIASKNPNINYAKMAYEEVMDLFSLEY